MTTLIQLLAPPCMGKSTMAAGLYHYMKVMGRGPLVEFIHEPARRRVYANLPVDGAGQLTATTELYEYIQDVIKYNVDILIVDTHILSPLLYTEDSVATDLAKALNRELERQCSCITLSLVGEPPPYSSEGRSHKDRPSLIDINRAINYIANYRHYYVNYMASPKDVIEQLLDAFI